MVRAGINVVSRGLAEDVASSIPDGSAIFNKYTIHSMSNEVRWALDPDRPFPGDAAFVETSDGKYVDLQLGGVPLNLPLEETRRVRAAFTGAIKAAAEADVCIATLGLAEAWFDNELGMYLNMAPSLGICRRYPRRFEFRTLDYMDIYEGLTEFRSTIKRFGKPEVKFLLTVSPVALHSTFRSHDVLVANTYSKAVQRAALEQFVMEHDDVDYFPSFEAVTLTPATEAWSRSDFRHVSPYLVRRIMSSVLTSYIGDDIVLNTISDEILKRHKARDYESVMQLAATTPQSELEKEAIYAVGLAYKKNERWAEARDLFSGLAASYPEWADASQNATLCKQRAAAG